MNRGELREKVRAAYSSVALEPEAPHPFPVGRAFAETLGYEPAWLDSIPATALEAFAGVSNVACFAELPESGNVLDLGCGAGLDSLLLARRMGPGGRVIGMDFSTAMLERARTAAYESETGNVSFCRADAERLPLRDGSIDVAVVNGIFNLNPAREAIFRELARCVRSGGRLYAAELVLRDPLAPEVKASERDWFA